MIKINYNVDEKNWKKNFPQFKKYISKTVEETISAVDAKISKNISITFFLTSNKKMRELNLKFRKKNYSTNVLSFPMQTFFNDSYLLGDIVLANKTLIKESIEQKISRHDHLCKMTIHGMLHLLRYDHKTEKQFKQMNKFEELIYRSVKHKI